MDRKDKISDSYREQVNELLDNQWDLDPINPLNQEELDEIWDEISTEMDIVEVWNDISSDLDIVMPVDSGSGIIFRSIAVILIILIGMIPVKKAILDSVISQPDILIDTQQNDQSAELTVKNQRGDYNKGEQVKEDISPTLRSSFDNIEEGYATTREEKNRTGLTQGPPTPVSSGVVSKVLGASRMADSDLGVSPDKIPAEKSGIPQVLFPGDLKKIKLFSKTDFDNLKNNDNPSTDGFSSPLTDRGRISGGLITLFRNTWLLNHETMNGLKSESLNTTEIVFFPDIGLSLNYSLNKTWLLQADGFFSSNTGQHYLDYIYGHYSRKKITLNYSTIYLSVKYKFTGSGSITNCSSVNLLAGGYLSVLNYANQEINNNVENISDQYGKIDAGVRLGGEFEFQIFDQLSIAPGLVVSFGIPNIYKGDGNIPGYLRSTHNGSIGFQLAFYYSFK